MRLTTDHPLFEQMGTEEIVLRRFRPRDTEEAAADGQDLNVDEGLGCARVLTSSALRWDDDGCSVYRVDVLDAAEIPHEDILHPTYRRLARAKKVHIDEFTFTFADETVAQPFHVEASPYPFGFDNESSPDFDAAHASIVMDSGYGSTRRRQIGRALARHVFTFDEIDAEELAADIANVGSASTAVGQDAAEPQPSDP